MSTKDLQANSNALRVCPFCGGEASVQTTYGYGVSEAFCLDCGAHTGHPPGGCTEAEAIAAWNTRTATTDAEFARAVHDGNLWRRVKGHIRCRNCGLNIESVIALDGCNEHAIKHCPNCGAKVVGE